MTAHIMNEAKRTSVRVYYESLSDEALLAEADLGRDAYTSEAWTIIADQLDLRGLRHGTERGHGEQQQNETGIAERSTKQQSHVERLAASIDALPPSIKPAVFGALIIVMFAMTRGAWIVLPIAIVYVLATSPEPWSSLMTGAGIALLAMLGGALSGFAYSLIGRHLRTAIPRGYYLTGIVTLAPYMVMLTFISRLADGVSLWQRPRPVDLAIGGFLTLLFGTVIGRAWFGPDEKVEGSEQAT